MRMWKRNGGARSRDQAVQSAYQYDHAISEELAREAAEAGSPQAMAVYGIGLGDLGRTDEAVHWLEKAADAGDPLAPAALATLHWDRQNAVQAVRWLRTAETAQGPVDARISLLQVWARSTVPFDRPPRPAGTPTTDAEKGRAAERGGGLSPPTGRRSGRTWESTGTAIHGCCASSRPSPSRPRPGSPPQPRPRKRVSETYRTG